MDGGRLMAELAREPRLAQAAVVALTADARIEEKAGGSAVVGCLTKPVDLDALFGFVRRFVG